MPTNHNNLVFLLMKKVFLMCFSLLSAMGLSAKDYVVKSPDGKLVVTISDENQKMTYRAEYEGNKVMLPSSLGLSTDIEKSADNGSFTNAEEKQVEKSYALKTIKTSQVHYVANQLRLEVETPNKHKYFVNFQVSDNNVAFRYELPELKDTKVVKVFSESTSFRMPDATTTFICPQIVPMVGFARSKPSYEEEYKADAPMNVKSQFGQGYTFPCLFNLSATVAGKKGEQLWALVSETGTTSNYCACRLSDFDETKGYTVLFPQEGENNGIGSTIPAFSLPGETPWRTITVGSSLKPIVETTIPYDVVDPLYEASQEYKPGRYTWSWLIWQDNSCNYNDQVTFIDLANKYGYEYILVDALWDTQIGRDKMEQLSAYAQSKGVKLLVWYNSNGIQNDAPQGPRNIMNNSIARKKEMKWLKKLGVAGIKVDFFGSDKQETMKLYEDILSDANEYGIQVIFHGCTLPRGWERMYPNFVASEAALASENVFFSEHHAKMEGFEMTMHPFSRNAVGSFDWGGVIMNKFLSKDNKSRHKRYTSDIFELATAITNQTSVNCVAVTPQADETLADWERDFMKEIPTTWDEVKYLDGYPTKYVILARRHGDTWYVAGINGTNEDLKVKVNLDFLAGKKVAFYYKDGVKEVKAPKTLKLTIPAMDGFIIK